MIQEWYSLSSANATDNEILPLLDLIWFSSTTKLFNQIFLISMWNLKWYNYIWACLLQHSNYAKCHKWPFIFRRPNLFKVLGMDIELVKTPTIDWTHCSRKEKQKRGEIMTDIRTMRPGQERKGIDWWVTTESKHHSLQKASKIREMERSKKIITQTQ